LTQGVIFNVEYWDQWCWIYTLARWELNRAVEFWSKT
jgi:hypothetical protein